jgi:hypothetical protein
MLHRRSGHPVCALGVKLPIKAGRRGHFSRLSSDDTGKARAHVAFDLCFLSRAGRNGREVRTLVDRLTSRRRAPVISEIAIGQKPHRSLLRCGLPVMSNGGAAYGLRPAKSSLLSERELISVRDNAHF